MIFFLVSSLITHVFQKEVLFCSEYLKTRRLSFYCFIFRYVGSSQNLNIQQEGMNTQKKEHFILSMFVRVKIEELEIGSGFLLIDILGVSGCKNYNKGKGYFYALRERGQNLKGRVRK